MNEIGGGSNIPLCEKNTKGISIEVYLINISGLFWVAEEKKYVQNKTTAISKIVKEGGFSQSSTYQYIADLEKVGLLLKTPIREGGGVKLTEKGVAFLEEYRKNKKSQESNDNYETKISKIIREYMPPLLELSAVYPNKKSLIIDYKDILKYDIDMIDDIISNPDKIIELFEKEVNAISVPYSYDGEIKVHIRFINIPQGYNEDIRNIVSKDINRFFNVKGMVTKSSDVLPKISVGVFQCPICGERKKIEQEKTRSLIFPSVCDVCKKPVRFKLLPAECKFIDIQRIEIQEPLEILKGGENAKKIEVWITDDLTGKILPGNNIEITGALKLIPPKDINDVVYRKFVDANNFKITGEEFTEIEISDDEVIKIKEFSKSPELTQKFKKFIGSTIYGYEEIKEAIILQLFGGSKISKIGKTKTRSEIHLLLIGDPGVAKSQILISASNIAPKSIYLCGKGTTTAGLTATAKKEKDDFSDGGWVIEGGAVVFASGGILCLDEMNEMKDEDKDSLRTPMSDGIVSVAKAGVSVTFKAETSILAAANPKFGRFIQEKTISEQFGLSAAIIDRFDLIFPIKDNINKENDKRISEQIGMMYTVEKNENPNYSVNLAFMRKYIAYAKMNCNPSLSENARQMAQTYYLKLRGGSNNNNVQTTPRRYVDILRLSSAAAKMRLSDLIEEKDVETAIRLTEYSLRCIAQDEESGKFDLDKITMGSKEKRGKNIILSDILDNLTNKGQINCDIEDVIKVAKEQGIDDDAVKKYLENAKKEGRIFEPTPGKIAVI
ncbi:MAG: hypothetical protein BWK75_02185 [Candidatus Altiarchaeales archaeon A3]|nr:MAG: hypothetical protein BWK75_02185 [Candidatus Altiarchaeales archaeon A3]